jgi:hypothetical protein
MGSRPALRPTLHSHEEAALAFLLSESWVARIVSPGIIGRNPSQNSRINLTRRTGDRRYWLNLKLSQYQRSASMNQRLAMVRGVPDAAHRAGRPHRHPDNADATCPPSAASPTPAAQRRYCCCLRWPTKQSVNASLTRARSSAACSKMQAAHVPLGRSITA